MPFEKGNQYAKGSTTSGRKSADYETTKRRVIGKAWAMVDEQMGKKEIEDSNAA